MEKPQILRKKDRQIIEKEWGQLIWYASQELSNSKKMTIGQCILGPKKSNPSHYHNNCEEILHVLQGEISHGIGEREVILNEGDTITIPPNIIHNAKNLNHVKAILLISFNSGNRKTEGE